MKIIQCVVVIVSLGCLSCCNFAQDRKISNAYKFDKNGISKGVLENYLDRSITMVYFLSPDIPEAKRIYPFPDDDIRMIKNIGAKFIGRAIYRWGGEGLLNDSDFLSEASRRIKMMHEFDPEMIFQACLFEIITTDVDKVPVPGWVFQDFGMPVEDRTFSYADMLNDDGKMVDHWRENCSVPDISKLESKLWFYFLAASYIDIGCEAFHIGQVELIGMNDPDRTHWESIITKIRDYAGKRARRNWVIIDAHVPNGGLVKDGASLLDFNSFPLRIKEVEDQPYNGKLEVDYLDGIYLKSKGCTTPSGWKCDHLPYLVEFDNFGRSRDPNSSTIDSHFIWGWDEISWLSLQPEGYRNEFVEYVFNWVKKTDSDGHLEMPGCRMITCPNESSGSYRANTRSDACPIGYSQEETIKVLWSSSSPRIPRVEADPGIRQSSSP